MIPTAIYRCYDADGALLYVGVSARPQRRMWEHACRAEWAAEVARTQVEWHASRTQAEAAEREAIRAERPAHNRNYTHDFAAVGGDADVAGFIARVGEDAIAAAVGVTRRAVRLENKRGILPARWFMALCRAGMEPPEHIFRWATPPAGKPEAAE